eukprot:TRINITY_DN94133_c0_g1_i1.p1 TRINITY_DN94133_c0_g1~~TRINITY_DN94133_c0_g1_i1.p1  ORF type:complete len:275 (-),score=60.75 TRINITY_DN94133_c0_g1_i1:21-779(-)
MPWVLVTGGGSGIGRGLVHHFSGQGHKVLTCGRRAEALAETKRLAERPYNVFTVACDIGTAEGRSALLTAMPTGEPLKLLVQNAAIGDPAPIEQIDVEHFEASLRVNVVAPLALTQALLPALLAGKGRVLHLGTSVAHNAQRGTATYGVTKAAFHRLYQQLNAEGTGIPVGSLSPGMVDTEGVRDHVKKARRLDLPHVKYFDKAFENQWTTNMTELLRFVDELLAMDAETFASQEWRFSEWRKKCDKSDSSL